ncbi:hypothetical protein ACQ10C_15690, partial [Enterococcus faecalis]|uniref:hypothetical protein n=1 Tax=Enterococcus faecalis TaxID=1351 RepID=UPI003D6BA52B
LFSFSTSLLLSFTSSLTVSVLFSAAFSTPLPLSFTSSLTISVLFSAAFSTPLPLTFTSKSHHSHVVLRFK